MKYDLNELKKYPIIDIAFRMGLTPIKRGNFYTLKEADSTSINPRTNLFFRNSTGEHGNVIDFVKTFSTMSAGEAIRYLGSMSGAVSLNISKEDYSREIEKKEFKLPARAKTMKNVFAYLINTRKIDEEIVSKLAKEKRLYQDEKRNCVFVGYNENNEAVFANKRGTNTFGKRFIGDESGSDYKICFHLSNGSSKLIVTEGVIDALSIQTILKLKGRDEKEFDYLALSGNNKFKDAINHYMEIKGYSEIIGCYDNDEGGRIAFDGTRNLIEENYPGVRFTEAPPFYGKDYNAHLQYALEKGLYKKEIFTPNEKKEMDIIRAMIRDELFDYTEKDVNVETKVIFGKWKEANLNVAEKGHQYSIGDIELNRTPNARYNLKEFVDKEIDKIKSEIEFSSYIFEDELEEIEL